MTVEPERLLGFWESRSKKAGPCCEPPIVRVLPHGATWRCPNCRARWTYRLSHLAAPQSARAWHAEKCKEAAS